MMNHTLSNFPEAHGNTSENLGDELDDENYPLSIDRIRDKLSAK